MTAIRFDHRGAMYAVTFAAYDAIAVDVLKATVPAYARSWNRIRREWLIETVYGCPLAHVMRQLGHTVIGLNDYRDDSTLWAQLLFKRVGSRHQDSVYRALSRCLHPDVGGDTELQRELNQAHAELTANPAKGTPK